MPRRCCPSATPAGPGRSSSAPRRPRDSRATTGSRSCMARPRSPTAAAGETSATLSRSATCSASGRAGRTCRGRGTSRSRRRPASSRVSLSTTYAGSTACPATLETEIAVEWQERTPTDVDVVALYFPMATATTAPPAGLSPDLPTPAGCFRRDLALGFVGDEPIAVGLHGDAAEPGRGRGDGSRGRVRATAAGATGCAPTYPRSTSPASAGGASRLFTRRALVVGPTRDRLGTAGHPPGAGLGGQPGAGPAAAAPGAAGRSAREHARRRRAARTSACTGRSRRATCGPASSGRRRRRRCASGWGCRRGRRTPTRPACGWPRCGLATTP